jgi:hypothetical protein
MHDQGVASIEPDVAAVPGIQRYEIVAAARYSRPAREFIEKLKYNVVGEGVEIVLAIHKLRETFHDHVEERCAKKSV